MASEEQATVTQERPKKVREVKAPGPATQCLDVFQVAAAIRMSRSKVFELVADRTFPRPFKIGRKNLWREATVAAYLKRREEQARRS